jgi:predicted GNAT family N-acyltransferase
VVEQTCYYLDADGYDQKALHLFAEKEGKVVAYRCGILIVSDFCFVS